MDWDIGATYHYGWENLPFFVSFPVKNLTVNGSMSGNDLTSSLGTAVFTMEDITTISGTVQP